MGMQLNIKSDEAYRLATELAELTGESLTSAVLAALRQRLVSERRVREREAKIATLLEIGQEIRLAMGPNTPKSTDTDFLYDEFGLPR